VAKHHRSEARRLAALARHAARDVPPSTDPVDRAGEAVDAGREAAHLLAALAGLRPDQRSVVLLHAWEDLGYAEIADVLGIPIGTVRSRLSRARAKVRAAMDDHDRCKERS